MVTELTELIHVSGTGAHVSWTVLHAVQAAVAACGGNAGAAGGCVKPCPVTRPSGVQYPESLTGAWQETRSRHLLSSPALRVAAAEEAL